MTRPTAKLEKALGGQADVVLKEAGATHLAEFFAGLPIQVAAGDGVVLLARVRDGNLVRGRIAIARALTRALIRSQIVTHGQHHPEVLVELGVLGAVALRQGDLEEAERLLGGTFQAIRSSAGGLDPRVAKVARSWALVLVKRKRWAEAETVLETALRILRSTAPRSTGLVASQLGEVRVRLGKTESARGAMREAWESYREELGPAHKRTVGRARVYGKLLVQLGLHDQAVPVLREVAATEPTGEEGADLSFNLAVALEATGEKEEGLRLLEQSIRYTRQVGEAAGVPHPALADRLTRYANHLQRRGRWSEVEGLLLEALEIETRVNGTCHARVGHRHVTLGSFCAGVGRAHEALGWLESGSSMLRSSLGDSDVATRRATALLVNLLLTEVEAAEKRRDRELVRALLTRAWQFGLAVLGPEDERCKRVAELATRAGLRI